MPFLASGSGLHFLAHGSFLHLLNQQHSLFKSVSDSDPPASPLTNKGLYESIGPTQIIQVNLLDLLSIFNFFNLKSHLPCNTTYPQVLGIRIWALKSRYSAYQNTKCRITLQVLLILCLQVTLPPVSSYILYLGLPGCCNNLLIGTSASDLSLSSPSPKGLPECSRCLCCM